jgi:hypothetical protein
MKATVSATKALAEMIELEVDLTNVRAARARLTVGIWLLRIAAHVIGCGVAIEDGSRRPNDR